MNYDFNVTSEKVNGQQSVVYNGTTDGISYHAPDLVPFSNDTFAFSYYNSKKPNDFGVYSVSEDYQVTKVYEPLPDTQFIGTEIRGNSTEFIYYVFENGCPLLIIENCHATVGEFSLHRDAQMYSFCLLKGFVFLSVRNDSKSSLAADTVCMINFKGNIHSSQHFFPIFRLTSAGGNRTIGTDMNYDAFFISDKFSSLQIDKIDIPKEHVMFYTKTIEDISAHLDSEYKALMTLDF